MAPPLATIRSALSEFDATGAFSGSAFAALRLLLVDEGNLEDWAREQGLARSRGR